MNTNPLQARKILGNVLSRKQDVLLTFEGELGDGNGNVQVTTVGRENYSYVRVNGGVQEVYNVRVPFHDGLRVIVGYESSQSSLFQVLGARAGTEYVPGTTVPGTANPLPAEYYQWGGSDPLFIDKRLWLPRRISILSSDDPLYTGFLVRFYWDFFWDGTDWVILPEQVLDLSSYVPSTAGKEAFVLITLDTSGALVCTDGADVDIGAGLPSDIPAPPEGTSDVLAAIHLYYEQTAIEEDDETTDISDLRFTFFSGSGGSSVTPSDTVADETSFDITPDAGVSDTYSRGDHTHGTPTAPAGTGDVIQDGSVSAGNLVVWSADRHVEDGGAIPSGATTLADLTDVDLSTPPEDGQALIWDETEDVWKPGTVEGGGGTPGSEIAGALLMSTGVTDPPVPLVSSDGTDWLYSPGLVPLGTVNGRLTLETGVPVSTTDQTAQTTLYFTPYKGNNIAIFDGTIWRYYAFTELSISLSGKTASKPFDVFVYADTNNLPVLELCEWTNDTTRATALVYQNGVLVKSGATTRRYLGTIRTTATTGQCEDSKTKRFCMNYYNKVRRPLVYTDATQHTYNVNGFQIWNNGSGPHISFVVPDPDPVEYELSINMYIQVDNGRYGAADVVMDTTTSLISAGVYQETKVYCVLDKFSAGFVATGHHSLNVKEGTNGTQITFYNCQAVFILEG
jgi:hypothetical protein